jgi:hypothetical protein
MPLPGSPSIPGRRHDHDKEEGQGKAIQILLPHLLELGPLSMIHYCCRRLNDEPEKGYEIIEDHLGRYLKRITAGEIGFRFRSSARLPIDFPVAIYPTPISTDLPSIIIENDFDGILLADNLWVSLALRNYVFSDHLKGRVKENDPDILNLLFRFIHHSSFRSYSISSPDSEPLGIGCQV